jgi:hypothetical protein
MIKFPLMMQLDDTITSEKMLARIPQHVLAPRMKSSGA